MEKDVLKVEITVEDSELGINTNVPGLVAISLLTSAIEVITDDLIKKAQDISEETKEELEEVDKQEE